MNEDELFEKGLKFLEEDNRLGALACFEKGYGIKKTPRLQSYLGFCIAMERGQIAESVKMCEDAIAREHDNPVHYLNLGRIFLKLDRKEDAIATFRKGLSFGDNGEIREILDELGTRKRPLFPFLPRSSVLNKYVGLILRFFRLR